MAALVCIPTNSALGFPFLHNLSNTCVCWFVYDGHSDWYEVVSHCGFNLHLSDGYWCWASFHMSLGPVYVLLEEVFVQVLCPFFNWVVCLPGVKSCKFFIYFGDQTLVWDVIGKCISHTVGSLFILLVFPLVMQQLFNLTKSHLCSLYAPCSRGRISENIAAWNIWNFPTYVLL